jgi:hypothetical protein
VTAISHKQTFICDYFAATTTQAICKASLSLTGDPKPTRTNMTLIIFAKKLESSF